MNVKHILLCEDDARDEKLTLTALAENNLANDVFVVRDGAEALDYLFYRGKFKLRASGNPVAIVLDLKMPKLDGLEVLRIVKADEHLKAVPVVVLTSSRETRDLARCYQRGVNAYVVKPMDFSDFMNAVKQLGTFWAVINVPPPRTRSKDASSHDDEVVSPEKRKDKNEISAPHPALGG